jgi:hypothetical protein
MNMFRRSPPQIVSDGGIRIGRRSGCPNSQRIDDAYACEAGACRKRGLSAEPSGDDMKIARIQGRQTHSHQQFSSPGHRIWQVPNREHILGLAVSFEDECFHVAFSFSSVVPRCSRSSAMWIQNDYAHCAPFLEHSVRFGRPTKPQHSGDVGTNCAVERVDDQKRQRLMN